jgi:hypothetical protein
MQIGDWIAGFPFVLGLLAGAVAYATGLLLRRGLALATGGRAPAWPSGVIRGLGLAFMAASFAWTWSLQPRTGQVGLITSLGTFVPSSYARESLTPGQVAFIAASGLLILAGLALAGWAITARIRSVVLGRTPDRLADRAPYSALRRPLMLGIGVALLGATLLADTLGAWVCLLLGCSLGWVLQELDDLDLRSRVDWIAEQQRRIPRFIPRLPSRRA